MKTTVMSPLFLLIRRKCLPIYLCIIALGLMSTNKTHAFCGFFVAKADAKLFNKASQVILVRDGDQTVVTMQNDFKGDVKDFAMVVPVPQVLKRNQIKTVNKKVFETLDSYSGPRLVEYYDHNPCAIPETTLFFSSTALNGATAGTFDVTITDSMGSYGVAIEAEYKVDEYDILILSAEESNGLKRWLDDNGYKIPDQAEEVLEPYIKNNLKFFVVKVDAKRLAEKGNEMSPIQISYESPKFMLPIRLGMANADGFQDMIVYGLTRQGRIECTNYRTVEIPTARNIPTFVRDEFGAFYKDVFDREYEHQGKNAVFLEYAWNVTPSWNGMKCDPCVGPPPINTDLANAGVTWDLQSEQVFFTRLHVRYTKDKFPQDLLFQVTPNKERFQGRYIITNPATGEFDCEEGQEYLVEMVNRRQRELDELQALAGWDPNSRPYYVEGYRKLIKDEAERNGVMTPTPEFPSPPPPAQPWVPKAVFSVLLGMLLIYFPFREAAQKLLPNQVTNQVKSTS